jgi:hypothetical protein
MSLKITIHVTEDDVLTITVLNDGAELLQIADFDIQAALATQLKAEAP